MYIVLYYQEQTISQAAQGYLAEKVYVRETAWNFLEMETFSEEQEAIDFAKKNDGFIVIPAKIQSKIVKVEGK